jgi:hypothetical protein
MRTALFLIAGLLLLAACALLGRLFSTHYPAAPMFATAIFLGLWFVIAAVNMWIGVARAGYPVTEELPILLLIFGLPAIAAAVLRWRGL